MSLSILSAASAFLHSTKTTTTTLTRHKIPFLPSSFSSSTTRCMSNTDSSSSTTSNINISRFTTLQTLLQKSGAPGSRNHNIPNDLQPTSEPNLNLHPHLFPIARSTSNPDYYICGLRRAYADDALYESSTNAPWPIVESVVNGMGYNLLSLNSEQLMRRMVAEADGNDDNNDDQEIIDIYNEELGKGLLADKSLDVNYEPGSVEKLGYGASKYVLLRVGPFPDLYEEMANQHSARGDEASSLIAAEASNGKFTGFGSTFRFYAQLLASFPNREDETRDAARVCLRLPLPSMGMYKEDFESVAEFGRFESLEKMEEMYEKIKAHEEDDEQSRANMTGEQMAIEDANKIMDKVVFQSEQDWSSVRKELGDIYSKAGLDDMAVFVDPSRS